LINHWQRVCSVCTLVIYVDAKRRTGAAAVGRNMTISPENRPRRRRPWQTSPCTNLDVMPL